QALPGHGLTRSPRPNSGLPEFGNLRRPKSDISDFGWGEGAGTLRRTCGASISSVHASGGRPDRPAFQPLAPGKPYQKQKEYRRPDRGKAKKQARLPEQRKDRHGIDEMAA